MDMLTVNADSIPGRRPLPRRGLGRLPITLIVPMMLAGICAQAQGAAGPPPDNASPRQYGSGWECDSGYRRVKDGCIAVSLPANAHLTFPVTTGSATSATANEETPAPRNRGNDRNEETRMMNLPGMPFGPSLEPVR